MLKYESNILKTILFNLDITKLEQYTNAIKNKQILEHFIIVARKVQETFRHTTYSYTLGQDIRIYQAFKFPNNDILTICNDNYIRIWKWTSKYTKCEIIKHGEESIFALIKLKNGNFISRAWGELVLWEGLPGDNIKHTSLNIAIEKSLIESVIQLDNEDLVLSTINKKIILINNYTPLCKRYAVAEAQIVKQVDIEIDGSKLFTLGKDKILVKGLNNLVILNYSLDLLAELKHKNTINFYLSLDKGNLLTCEEGYFHLWNGNQFKLTDSYPVPREVAMSIFLKKKGVIITDYLPGQLAIWQIDNLKEFIPFRAHTNYINVIFMIGEETFITGSRDYTLKIWNFEKIPKLLRVLEEHRNTVYYISVLGQYILTCSHDNSNILWK
jgi:WD40 repeat protein